MFFQVVFLLAQRLFHVVFLNNPVSLDDLVRLPATIFKT
jgi:hypothetical protein